VKFNTTSPTFERRAQRGFTLVELMIVVLIIGVLASLAIYSVRSYVQASKTAEAREVIGSIKAGEEAYFDETFRYLGVTGGVDTYHPITSTDGRIKADWSNTGCSGCLDNFRTLGVQVNAPVAFRYGVAAGSTGLAGLSLGASVSGTPFANAPASPYYVVKAISDLNGDTGKKTVLLSSNFSAEIYSENSGE